MKKDTIRELLREGLKEYEIFVIENVSEDEIKKIISEEVEKVISNDIRDFEKWEKYEGKDKILLKNIKTLTSIAIKKMNAQRIISIAVNTIPKVILETFLLMEKDDEINETTELSKDVIESFYNDTFEFIVNERKRLIASIKKHINSCDKNYEKWGVGAAMKDNIDARKTAHEKESAENKDDRNCFEHWKTFETTSPNAIESAEKYFTTEEGDSNYRTVGAPGGFELGQYPCYLYSYKCFR